MNTKDTTDCECIRVSTFATLWFVIMSTMALGKFVPRKLIPGKFVP
jgi:hypothetical protein